MRVVGAPIGIFFEKRLKAVMEEITKKLGVLVGCLPQSLCLSPSKRQKGNQEMMASP